MKNTMPSLETIKKVVVIRLDAAGDLILSTPFFRNLRQNLPNAEITAVVRNYTADILKNNPNIDEILVYPEDASFSEKLKFIGKIRQKRVDWAVSLSPVTRAFLLTSLCGASKSFSYVYSGRILTNLFAKMILSDCQTIDVAGMLLRGAEVTHEVRQTFVLLKSLGIEAREYPLEIFPDRCSFEKTEKLRQSGRLIGMHISPKWFTESWTYGNFADLAIQLLASYSGFRILLTYGAAESSIAQELKEKLDSEQFLFRGGMSFSDWAAHISCCSAFISPDTGALHCAAAMKVPVAAVYERSTFAHCSAQWAPWMVPSFSLQKSNFEDTKADILTKIPDLIPCLRPI